MLPQILALLLVVLCSGTSRPPEAAATSIPAGAAAERVLLSPHFVAGQSLRYQMDFRSAIESRSAGPIENPEAPSQLQLSANATVRVDVLEAAPPASPSGWQAARLRATCEKSAASVRSDAFDPQAAKLEEEYRKLEGRVIEFTVGADGRLGEVQGLDELLSDERAASGLRQWLQGIAGSAALPRRGISLGEKWHEQRAIPTLPLAGVVSRADSTYLRNEACQPPALAKLEGPAAAARGEQCAVILTEFQMNSRRAGRDATPEEYRRRGLRTRGEWTSAGESLSYVSLRTGWVVSVTESGNESFDVTIASTLSGSQVRYIARLRTQSQISLLAEPSPAAPSP